jgi:hypothetical protein
VISVLRRLKAIKSYAAPEIDPIIGGGSYRKGRGGKAQVLGVFREERRKSEGALKKWLTRMKKSNFLIILTSKIW